MRSLPVAEPEPDEMAIWLSRDYEDYLDWLENQTPAAPSLQGANTALFGGHISRSVGWVLLGLEAAGMIVAAVLLSL